MAGYSYTIPPHRATDAKVVILIVGIPRVRVDLTVVRVPVDTGNLSDSNYYDYSLIETHTEAHQGGVLFFQPPI